MMPRRIALALGAVLALTVTACGRPGFGHGRARMGWFQRGGMRGRGGPPGHRMMAMQDPIARMLDHQADLKLTTAQVNNLIAIDDKLLADNSPMRQKLAGWRGSMGQNRRDGNRQKPDSAQMAKRRTMHDSAMTVFRSIRENNWRATSAAYALLTPDQLTTAAQLQSRGRGGRGGGSGPGGFMSRGGMGPGGGPPGAGGGRPGMPGGGYNRRGMMMRGGPGQPPTGE